MNIFVLDLDIMNCAEYHVDRHVTKMILEHAQILSTVCRRNGIAQGYKETHVKHPCTLWVGESLSNWLWLVELTFHLNEEYKYRYDKKVNHKSWDVIRSLDTPDIVDIGLTPFAQAMPSELKSSDVVSSYRKYYIRNKSHLAVWTKRDKPSWYP